MKSKTSFRTIQVIFWALIMGEVLLGAALVLPQLDMMTFEFSSDTMTSPFFLIMVGVFLQAFVVGSILFTKSVKKGGSSFSEKLAVFQAASIIQWALFEGASMLGFVFGMTAHNLLFVVCSLGSIIYQLAVLRPTHAGIIQTMNLSPKESSMLKGTLPIEDEDPIEKEDETDFRSVYK